MTENTPTENLHEDQTINAISPPLMSWSLKAIDQPPRIRRIVILAGLTPATAISFSALWSLYFGTQEDYEMDAGFIPAALIIGLILTAICRQKTVFNYRIYAEHAEVDFYHYFPEYSGLLFKSIVGIAALVIVGLAIYTGSWLLLLIGPAAIVIGSAKTLLSWEPPTPSLAISFPWIEHNFVTVDRKHRIIVIHSEDWTEGFDFRFPTKELMEQYLTFLRTVLCPTIQYKEDVWRW